MATKNINQLPDGSGNLSNDDLVIFMNDPSGDGVTQKITYGQFKTAITSGISSGLSNVVEDTTPQLGGTLDANGNTIDMGVNVITDAAVGQWNTAYGWDNHASAGYIKNVVEDTTPQLGGNLDVDGNSITDSNTSDFAGGIVRINPTIDINGNRIFYRTETDSGLNIRSDNTTNKIYLYSYGDGNGVGVGNVYITESGVDIYSNWQEGGVGEKKWKFDQDGTLTLPDYGDIKCIGDMTIGTLDAGRDVNIQPQTNGSINLTTDGTGDISLILDGGAAYVLGGLNISASTTFGSDVVGGVAPRITIFNDDITASTSNNVRIAGGDNPLEDDTAGDVILNAGDNTFLGGLAGRGAGGSIRVHGGDAAYGGSVTISTGAGYVDGDAGDIRLNPALVNGNGVDPTTGKNGRVTILNGAFRPKVFTNTSQRDQYINNAGEGDMCYVTGEGLQIHDGTSWQTLAIVVPA